LAGVAVAVVVVAFVPGEKSREVDAAGLQQQKTHTQQQQQQQQQHRQGKKQQHSRESEERSAVTVVAKATMVEKNRWRSTTTSSTSTGPADCSGEKPAAPPLAPPSRSGAGRARQAMRASVTAVARQWDAPGTS
jgi:hypothetical protein